MNRQHWLGSLIIALVACGPLAAQAKVSTSAKPSGRSETASRPSSDAQRDLGKVARDLESAVMIVGGSRRYYGTAWVVSKEHRLLVTNAHVIDQAHIYGGKTFVIPSGSATTYKVEKWWYHPGLRRHMKENEYATIRSMDPKDGDVFVRSPDLAILQLSSYGPDLPAEFPLATPDEIAELFGQPVAMFGFPAHDNKSIALPRIGENANGTFHTGVVSRITDFDMSTTVPDGELQFVQHTIQNFGGFSGSPIFLSNGSVVAINNCGRGEVDRGQHASLSWGIRVDAVWEMLVYHGLDSKVSAKFDKDKLLLERYRERDERSEQARANLARAKALVEEAAHMIDVRQDFRGGADKCIQAIDLAPGYAPAHRGRSVALTNYWVMMSKGMSKKEQISTLSGALEHAKKYVNLVPNEPRAIISMCLCRTNLAIVTQDMSVAEEALEDLDTLMKQATLSTKARAEAHSAKAVAYCLLKDYEAARGHHNEAIRLYPEGAVLWSNRGNFWTHIGRHDLAAEDYARARELREQALTRK